MPDLANRCEPDCVCGCGFSTCSCRVFRIPPEWTQRARKVQPEPLAPWDPDRPSLWQRIKDRFYL